MKQENRIFEKFLNVLVLLGSLFIIIIVSIELLSVRPVLSEQFILNTHLIVCFIGFFCPLVLQRSRLALYVA